MACLSNCGRQNLLIVAPGTLLIANIRAMPHGSLERLRIRDVPPLDVWIRTCYDQSVSQHWNSGILYAPPFFRKGRTIAVNGDHHYVCRLTAQEALRDNTLIKLELRNCPSVSPLAERTRISISISGFCSRAIRINSGSRKLSCARSSPKRSTIT